MRKLRRMDFTKTESEGRETTLVRMFSGKRGPCLGQNSFKVLSSSYSFLSPEISPLKAQSYWELPRHYIRKGWPFTMMTSLGKPGRDFLYMTIS